ncbi:MAG TPA: 3-hydroxyacyl-CoA dehydrogenase NAD-binding domain-containing protein [Polyangiaceae bacterium]|nr:3-hydroxyacyl-CoA dehydrogenase NAD-binding domain-containing protein [Polyangiaceae bacterium]
MSEMIRTAAVIGAGVMGSAIAAHLAGAGVRVHLLDVVPAGASAAERNKLATGGIEKALKATPAPFFDPDAARLVTPGNLEDHLARLAECDLVVEAVVENLEIKQKLFTRIAPHLSATCVVASNTSGLSVAKMNEVLPQELQERFLVLHFFNPVRYMRLLEVVPGPKTSASVVERLTAFGEWLGKGIVLGKDTTNFVANRIGVYSMMVAMHQMLKQGLRIETVDAIAGKPMARPKSAVFQTGDIVGIDTLLHVAKNCYDSLPNDPERDVFVMPEFVVLLAKQGNVGRKSDGGFYKKVGKSIQVWDLEKSQYVEQQKVELASVSGAKGSPGSRIAKLCAATDAGGQFAWAVVSKTLLYCARLVGEIADDIVAMDRAMRWGFNWDLGPFEVWDALGVKKSVERMKADGLRVPEWIDAMLASGRESFYAGGAKTRDFFDTGSKSVKSVPRHPKELTVAACKEDKSKIVAMNSAASLVDIGDGVLCVELHTKMNTIDGDVIAMVNKAVDLAEQRFEALVIGNDSEHFSAGANLMMIVGAAMQKQWGQIDSIIAGLQNALQRLRYARVPVVGALSQFTLGGGAELAMACDAVQAHAETYMGLVEVGVGLVPAGGGCLRMVERYTAGISDIEGADLLPHIGQASLNIAMAKVSSGADDARRMRYLRAVDGISLNRDFLLYEAKQKALGMARAGYRPPRPPLLKAVGYDAAKTISVKTWGMVEGRWASAHDALIANKVAHILCGGTVAAGQELSEQHYLDLEREAFLQLCGEPKTHQRIEAMLTTSKPLRN